MTVKECYLSMGADYEDVLRRFRTDERVCKFLAMLLRDSSFTVLEEALNQADYATAFRAAHTIKGVAMNLSLTQLINDAAQLTEILRPQTPNDDIQPAFQKFKNTYDTMSTAVNALLSE